MLSFELSAIDFILTIAVIILLILYVAKLSAKSTTQEKTFVEEAISSKKMTPTVTGLETSKETQSLTRPPTDSPKCPHGFGYLKKLAKNAPIPDKCLSCSRIMECFGSDE